MLLDDCSDEELVDRLENKATNQEEIARQTSINLTNALRAELAKQEELIWAATDTAAAKLAFEQKTRIEEDIAEELKTLTGLRKNWERKAAQDTSMRKKNSEEILVSMPCWLYWY